MGGEGGSAHFWTLVGFQALVHITLPACSDFLLLHPHYLVKTFFLLRQGKHRVLSPRSPACICSTAPFPSASPFQNLMIFRLPIVTLSRLHLCSKGSQPTSMFFAFWLSGSSCKMSIRLFFVCLFFSFFSFPLACCCQLCKLHSLIE